MYILCNNRKDKKKVQVNELAMQKNFELFLKLHTILMLPRIIY